jgi:hypothetical protein
MRFLLIVTFLLQFGIPVYSQSIDSISRGVDSSSKALQEAAKKFQRLEDSLAKLQIQQSLDQNSKSLDLFLADMKEREKKEKRQLYIRIGLGVAFLAIVVYGLVRRRKKKNST